MPRIVPNLWFGTEAQEAAKLYCGTSQICPGELGEVPGDPNPARADRVMQAMLGMGKLDICAVRAAAQG